jgi:hypothetical protein
VIEIKLCTDAAKNLVGIAFTIGRYLNKVVNTTFELNVLG